MKKILWLLLCFPLWLSAQDKGIEFIKGLSWNEIKAKAKAENKYIFVDAFATWCGPCKAMDKEVFTDEKAGEAVNGKFIAVKVQMDQTKTDNEEVKSWYEDAKAMQNEAKIQGFPSFLFYGPDGELVYKDLGYKTSADFIRMVSNVSDPLKQYPLLLKNYNEGKKDYQTMAYLALTALTFGDRENAERIAKDYNANYLSQLSDEAFCTKENLELLIKFPSLLTSENKLFYLSYNKPAMVDKIMQEGMANAIVNHVIKQEEIEHKLWKSEKPVTQKPDWKKIAAAITKKYNAKYAEILIPGTKLDFYSRIGDWKTWVMLKEKEWKDHPLGKEGGLSSNHWAYNKAAWTVFTGCNDKEVLSKALEWSDRSIEIEQPNPNVQYLDTRANLLYKLGRVKEAIEQEQKAIQVDNENARKAGGEKGVFYDSYSAILEKMKKGIPTWPVKK